VQHPEKTLPQLMGEDSFSFTQGDGSSDDDGFQDFDI